MLKNIKIAAMLFLVALCLVTMSSFVQAEPANNNIVLAAGEMWGTYTPPNYDYNWPRYGKINEDLSQVDNWDINGSLFYTSRCVTSSLFGNPGWSWMSSKVLYDFTNVAFAIEYNDNADFAAANAATAGDAAVENYAVMKFNHSVPGWDDPSRNYHIPSTGGAVLSEDRTFAYGTSAWPTQLGVDVKMTVYNWTTNWGHLDDFHLVEYEMTNTGMADLNGDGTVDVTNNPIKNLVFGYVPGSFHFRLGTNSGRSYYVDNNNYRGIGCDQTFDENGSPYNIAFQAIGSQKENDHSPSISTQWEYWDGYAGFGFLGAKTLKDGTWQEKFLSFKDASGNQIVPTVGEGEQRGWFTTNQTGWNGVNSGNLAQIHSVYMGAFYKDGGIGNDASALDYSPNPNLFSSGTAGNPSTFVVKDKADWQYPNGARELLENKMMYAKDGGAPIGMNPADTMPLKDRALEPDVITRGWISQYEFDYDPIEGFGPISIDVGETVRVYFIRGAGFRMQGLRKTFTTARAVFDAIGPDGDVKANVPAGPPVPEIKVSGSQTVKPLIKWQDPTGLGDCDGIKIYKCVAWPRYNSLYDLYPTHDTWWKSMDPDNEHDPMPYNPLFTKMELLVDQQGNSWGPYHLVKVIPVGEFASYKNPASDAGEYPYAWEDDTYTSAGQSYWYYVSSYKEGAANAVPAGFQGLEDSDIAWMESGKVNYNGRTGLWESTWPYTWRQTNYPAESDIVGSKKVGVPFVLVSPPGDIAQLKLGNTKIGVRPNPYKRVAFHDASGKHQVMFYNLPMSCNLQIYDLAGMLVDEIQYNSPTTENGVYFWDMYSKNGNEVASGLYVWVVKYDGGTQNGTFAIIR